MKLNLSILLFISGILLILLSFIRGGMNLALLLFIPVFYGSDPLALIGIFFIILAIIYPFFRHLSQAEYIEHLEPPPESVKSIKTETKKGGILLIGPIPIIYADSLKTAYGLIAIVIVLMIVSLIILYTFIFKV